MLSKEERHALAARLRLGEGCDPPPHMVGKLGYYSNEDSPGWYSGSVKKRGKPEVWEDWVLGVCVVRSQVGQTSPFTPYSYNSLLAWLERP